MQLQSCKGALLELVVDKHTLNQNYVESLLGNLRSHVAVFEN